MEGRPSEGALDGLAAILKFAATATAKLQRMSSKLAGDGKIDEDGRDHDFTAVAIVGSELDVAALSVGIILSVYETKQHWQVLPTCGGLPSERSPGAIAHTGATRVWENRLALPKASYQPHPKLCCTIVTTEADAPAKEPTRSCCIQCE
jgi:hypothetical protein